MWGPVIDYLGLCDQFMLCKKTGLSQKKISKALQPLKKNRLLRCHGKRPSFLEAPVEILWLHENAKPYFKKCLSEEPSPHIYKYDVVNSDRYEHHFLLNIAAYCLDRFKVTKVSYGDGGRSGLERRQEDLVR